MVKTVKFHGSPLAGDGLARKRCLRARKKDHPSL